MHASTVLAHDHCLAPGRAKTPIGAGRYGALFPDLPPLEVDTAALHALGRPGGPCDLGIDFAPDTDAKSAAVWPFFGQFVAHDITADRTPVTHHAKPNGVHNFRAPKANLESVYGAGPAGAPYLYVKDDPAKLLLSADGNDVPRNREGLALIGDPRNDVHLFLSQMTVAFVKLHNVLVDGLREEGTAEGALFDEARRLTTWHYQHVIVREFLPSVIGANLAAELLDNRLRLYHVDGEPYIPFEFADAAYRYGHAQIRSDYQVNARLGPVPLFPDLIGFRPVPPERTVDWTLLIDVDGHPAAQRAKRIDSRLPPALIALPARISGSEPGTDYASLANRDLQRGKAVSLASGEAIARRLGFPPLTAAQIGLADHGWIGETPLWLYILKEAEVLHSGEQLGPVGGRVVGEVIVGIIDADPESFRSFDSHWQPTLRGRRVGSFGLADILVPPR